MAFVAQAKARWSYELFRNVPGHLRIRVSSLGTDAAKAVIQMVSADPDESMTELGVSYSVPAGSLRVFNHF